MGDMWPCKCIYLLWVELEATVFRFSGTGLVSSGCTEFGVSAHTDSFDKLDKEREFRVLMHGLRSDIM